MIRKILLFVVPLVLPTVIYYLICLYLARQRKSKIRKWSEMPLFHLVAAGVVLTILVLVFTGILTGTEAGGEYVPPSFEQGKISPARTYSP